MLVVLAALLKGSLTPQDVKEILISIVSGTIGVERGYGMRQDHAKSKPVPPAAAVALALVLGLLMLNGCATSEPYAGPVGPPTLTGDEWYWPHGIDQRWTRETVLHVNNSTPEPLDAVLDCDSAFRHARKWPGSRFMLHVPPMTVQHILLDPHDHVCSLFPMEPDDGQ